jgi:hypothetical protein
MRFRLTLVFAGLLAVPSLSLAQKVNFDYDHGANFSMFHTYRLIRVGDNPAISQLYDQRIQAAMEEELSKKGLRRVQTGEDVVVAYQGAVGHETQYTTFNNGFGPSWGWGPGYYGGGSSISTTTATNIPTGQLTVDIFDPAKKQLLWKGTASDTLSDKPDKNNKKIQKAVQKLFDKYPPKEKK